MGIVPAAKREAKEFADRAVRHKQEYQAVQAATGLPWPMIAAIHEREGGGNFKTYLGNGQRLDRKTTIVPAGRGPFRSFVDGAVDAVKQEGWGSIRDWRLEKMLFYAELFNGAGYNARGLPSPYLWAGTTIQRAGKFVSDGKFSRTAWDRQLGVATMLAAIAEADPQVRYIRETA